MHRIILTLVCIFSFSTAYADADFDKWLIDLRSDALADGISSETLDATLTDIALIPRVIELDRNQPEFTLTFAQYLKRVVPVSRQKRAQARREEHRAMLDAIGAKYGDQPQFEVALWRI